MQYYAICDARGNFIIIFNVNKSLIILLTLFVCLPKFILLFADAPSLTDRSPDYMILSNFPSISQNHILITFSPILSPQFFKFQIPKSYFHKYISAFLTLTLYLKCFSAFHSWHEKHRSKCILDF